MEEIFLLGVRPTVVRIREFRERHVGTFASRNLPSPIHYSTTEEDALCPVCPLSELHHATGGRAYFVSMSRMLCAGVLSSVVSVEGVMAPMRRSSGRMSTDDGLRMDECEMSSNRIRFRYFIRV